MSEENVTPPNTPENGSSSEPVSIPELEAFIFRPDEFTDFIVPRRLSPQKVGNFLIQKISKDTKLEAFVQVEKVAKFYDTFEIAEKYRKFLDKTESNSEQIIRSIVITRIIAVIGGLEDLAFAKQYYEYLIPKVNTIDEFHQIIILHENLGLGKNSGLLRERINAKLKTLEEKKDSDFQAGIEFAKFQQAINLKLQQAEEIQAIKDKVLTSADRKQRLIEEIKMYISSEYGVPEITDPWSSRRIRQETWGQQPSDQVKRFDNPSLRRDVAIALRDFLTNLDRHKALPPKERESVELRILRAIKFFDGQVTEAENTFLSSFEGKQIDILSNSGYRITNQ